MAQVNNRYIEFYSSEIEKVLAHIPNIDKLRNSSILISGSTGMLCSAVVDVLFYLNVSRDYNIKLYLAGRSKERIDSRYIMWSYEYSFVEYDANRYVNLEIDYPLDYIIHGASNASPAAYVNEPVETMLANSIGTKVLLDLAKRKQAKLLYVSSSEIYGKKDNSDSYKENDYRFIDILNPRSCYPTSKRFAETLCSSYCAEYDIDTVIVRPGHIYGHTIIDKDDRASAQFTRSAVRGENIVMKSLGAQLRSYCFVLDCASATLCVLINGECGRAYNISNPNSLVTIRQMAEAIARAGNVQIIIDAPSSQEVKGYNLMDNSALDSTELERLGWCGEYTMKQGAEVTIKLIKLMNGVCNE